MYLCSYKSNSLVLYSTDNSKRQIIIKTEMLKIPNTVIKYFNVKPVEISNYQTK